MPYGITPTDELRVRKMNMKTFWKNTGKIIISEKDFDRWNKVVTEKVNEILLKGRSFHFGIHMSNLRIGLKKNVPYIIKPVLCTTRLFNDYSLKILSPLKNRIDIKMLRSYESVSSIRTKVAGDMSLKGIAREMDEKAVVPYGTSEAFFGAFHAWTKRLTENRTKMYVMDFFNIRMYPSPVLEAHVVDAHYGLRGFKGSKLKDKENNPFGFGGLMFTKRDYYNPAGLIMEMSRRIRNWFNYHYRYRKSGILPMNTLCTFMFREGQFSEFPMSLLVDFCERGICSVSWMFLPPRTNERKRVFICNCIESILKNMSKEHLSYDYIRHVLYNVNIYRKDT